MSVNITCKTCGKVFNVWPSRNRKYCSLKCYWQSKRKSTTTICPICGKIFEHKPAIKRVYCSTKCFLEYRNKILGRVTRACPVCGKVFECAKSAKKIYCSRKCAGANRSKRGSIQLICPICGREFRVVKSSAHYRKTCSYACLKEYWKRIRGEKTTSAFRRAIRRQLEEKFGDRCIICGWDETFNDVCHIIPKIKGGRYQIENLVFLCPNHHRMYDQGLIQLEHLVALIQQRYLDRANFDQSTQTIPPS